MIVEFLHSRPSFDIPEHTRHIARGRHDLTIIDKSTTTQVTRMSAKLSGYFRNLSQGLTGSSATATSFERVNGTYVVQTSASNELARWRVGTGHDPRRSERDGVDLVGGVGIPDNELAILRCGDDMSVVGRPMHSVDLGKMTFESTTDSHDDSR